MNTSMASPMGARAEMARFGLTGRLARFDEDELRVSLYMPYVDRSEKPRHIKARFLDLLLKAEDQLSAWYDKERVRRFTSPIRAAGFKLRALSIPGGIALFATSGGVKVVEMPVEPEEQVSVGTNFNLEPLYRSEHCGVQNEHGAPVTRN